MTFGLWARRASRLLHPAIIINLLKREWAEVDSNHRSKLQQIYSLSPLATRESAHLKRSIWNWLILILKINWEKPMIGLEPITCWLQISCSANWATSACCNRIKPQKSHFHYLNDSKGIWTPVTAVKGRCLNRLTMEPKLPLLDSNQRHCG